VLVFEQRAKERLPKYTHDKAELEAFLLERLRDEATGTRAEKPLPATDVADEARGSRTVLIQGESYQVGYSYEYLVHTANHLIKANKLKPSDCPVQVARGKRYLINTKPKHSNNVPFRAPKVLSNGLYIETHFSTAAAKDYAGRLLDRFGFSQDSFKIE
ncbi:MAG: hypothetical protein ABIK43_02395, partial [candidate division WOR-3 bacterium]